MICNLVTIPALSGVRSVSDERNRGALFRTISIEKLFFDCAAKTARLRSERRCFMPYYVYILKCADGSYYTGSTENLSIRLWQHQEGINPRAYTFSRRPVEFVWSEEVKTYHEALTHERQIKGWSRAKKEALIRGDFEGIHEIVKAE